MLLKFKEKENVFRSGGKHTQIKPASIRYKEQNPVYHFTDQFVNLIFFIVHKSLSILALKCEGPKIQ